MSEAWNHIVSLGLFLAGIMSIALIAVLVIDPSLFVGVHPIPLIVVTIVTAIVSFWGAREKRRNYIKDEIR